MASTNPFDLLDDDAEDPSLLIAAQQHKVSAVIAAADKKAPPVAAAAKPAKLPTKPLPPAQAVKESRNEGGRGGGGGGRGGRGYGRDRGPGGANRDFPNEDTFANENGVSGGFKEDRDRPERRGGYGGPRGGYRGGRRGGIVNGEIAEGDRSRRVYERRSGTGRGGEIKRDGAGRGNWGTPTDEIAPESGEPVVENEAVAADEKPSGDENVVVEKENPEKEAEETEPEEKQMTLEEYQKVLEEKRKALLALKAEERKVDLDKDFESMQLVSKKKNDDEVFIKLGSDKDKRKEAAEKDERAKKSVSINEFLRPAEGDGHYRRGGRGRSRGGRGGYGGGYGMNNASAPSIEDPSQFPSLGAN
uniref:RNA binding protein n=1 Tax=Suaeda glauca TaxID=397272 RepID=H8YU79_9CARY|nr:RNA binding protein [Suaeda glauca]